MYVYNVLHKKQQLLSYLQNNLVYAGLRGVGNLMISWFQCLLQGIRGGYEGIRGGVTPKHTRGCTQGIRGRGWKVYADIFS